MQTFAPYAGIYHTASVLDRKRLNKQITETAQIHRALTIPTYGWKSHPAVRMWEGHECALVTYNSAMATMWMLGGGRAHLSMIKMSGEHGNHGGDCLSVWPSWWGDEDFHRSHRSNLLRKDPDYYRPIFEIGLPDDLEYIWPTPLLREDKLAPPSPAGAR
jgi:hypothetical protein